MWTNEGGKERESDSRRKEGNNIRQARNDINVRVARRLAKTGKNKKREGKE